MELNGRFEVRREVRKKTAVEGCDKGPRAYIEIQSEPGAAEWMDEVGVEQGNSKEMQKPPLVHRI